MTESKSTHKPNADGVRTLPASVSLPESLIRIAERVSARGCRLFAVGGLVRNTLLGLPVSDIDICSALTPDETIELAHEMGFKVVPRALLSAWSKFTPTDKSLNTQPSVPTNTPSAARTARRAYSFQKHPRRIRGGATFR